MSNVNRWYASREAVKAALENTGATLDQRIGQCIESASEAVEKLLASRGAAYFIPVTETRYYPWPQQFGSSIVLYLDADLLAVTSLVAGGTTIASTDYFLEPVNSPPYRRIEIDLSSSASFQAGDTSQRSIVVTGRWAYSGDTKAAGTLATALSDTTGTTVVVSDASLIDVGDTILIDSEAFFVSERATVDTTADLNDTLTADNSDVTVTVTDGTKVKQGEVFMHDSEKMLAETINGNDITVRRAVDGSVLAAHSTGGNIYAFRTLTVVRGANGTTAATHALNAAITKYVPAARIKEYCIAKALSELKQGQTAYSGETAAGAAVNGVQALEDCVVREFGLVTV